jgi:hypothetical protein
MSWQEDLIKKAKELNIQKEETNGQETVRILPSGGVGSGRSNNSIGSNKNISNSSNSIGSRSSNVFRGRISKEINNVTEKEETKMITVEGALSDIDKLIEEATQAGDKVAVYLLKAQKVMIKFLSTMRSNQLLTEDDKKRIAADKAKRGPKVPQQ